MSKLRLARVGSASIHMACNSVGAWSCRAKSTCAPAGTTRRFSTSGWSSKKIRLRNAGYLIAYDEAEESFGLASRVADGDHVFLGYYGSLIETLEAM